MSEVNYAKANEVFNTLCSTLDSINFKYDAKPEDLLIISGMSGDDFPMSFFIKINAGAQVISFISPLPFNISEEKRVELAVAICAVNNILLDGSFDYDIDDGSISFRLTSSYRESTIGNDLFTYMIAVSTKTIDDFNDKFFMVDKNMMTLEQFLESLKNN